MGKNRRASGDRAPRRAGRALYFKAEADMITFLRKRARERRVSLSDAVREIVLREMHVRVNGGARRASDG